MSYTTDVRLFTGWCADNRLRLREVPRRVRHVDGDVPDAGVVTLGAVSDFGPPSNAHAYVFTPTDDTLLAGVATIGRLVGPSPSRDNDVQFNWSHTCAAPEPPTTTTTSTTTTINSTTPTAASTTIPAQTMTSGGAVGPASTTQLPDTGADGGLPVAVIGLAAVGAGGVLALSARRWKHIIPVRRRLANRSTAGVR